PAPRATADGASERAFEYPTNICRQFHTPRRVSAQPSPAFLLQLVLRLPGTCPAPPDLAPRYRAARARFCAARRPEVASGDWRAFEAVPFARAYRRSAVPALPFGRALRRPASRPEFAPALRSRAAPVRPAFAP